MKSLLLPISSFCKTGSGTTPSRAQADRYFGGDIPWVKSGELRESIVSEAEESVTSEALAETSLKIAPKGAVLVAMYGANVGRVGILGIDATTNQAVCHIVPDKDKADSRYIFHALQGKLTEFLSRSVGGAQPNISQQIIRETKIFLPPIATQKKIAAILDQAEALRSLRRQSIEQLDALARSVFLEMFGDPVTNPKRWENSALKNLCDEIHDCPHSTPVWTDSGVICLRTSNLTKGGWNWSDTRFVSEETYHERSKRGYAKAGDIILSREGTIGIASIVTSAMKICMGQRLVQLRPSKFSLTSEYILRHLLYVLDPVRISNLMVGSTSQHLNVKELKDLSIPLPPLTLQQQFADRIQSIETLKTHHRQSLATMDKLFNSLQHRAFRGEL
jgi:type I restriction enzyme, S subunit